MKSYRGGFSRLVRLHLPLILLLALCPPILAEEEARTALIVGVKDYRDHYFHGLDAPVEDAKAVQAKLQALGFQTEVLSNPNKRQLTEAVDAFGALLARRGGVGLFYFSGHGAMKSDEEANYLIPVGTNIRTENDLPEEAVNAQRVANRMKEAKNSLNLVLLDACRNHGLPRGDGAKSAGGGLAAMRGARGLIYFFATQPGAVSIEDTDAKRSVFTTALLRHMDIPGLSFMDMISDVTAETEKISLEGDPKAGAQTPFINGTVVGRFYFQPAISASSEIPQPVPGTEKVSPPAPAPNTVGSRLQFRLEADAGDSDAEILDGSSAHEKIRLSKAVLLDESAIASASRFLSQNGMPEIHLHFTKEGAGKFAEITKAGEGRRLAILFNGRVLTSPKINAQITGGEATISGNFSDTEIASILKALH
jgi:hypothetical protein